MYCFCGCKARIELIEDHRSIKSLPIDANHGDLLSICNNSMRNGNLFPLNHLTFMVDRYVYANHCKIYNDYDELIYDCDFSDYDCPCFMKRGPLVGN